MSDGEAEGLQVCLERIVWFKSLDLNTSIYCSPYSLPLLIPNDTVINKTSYIFGFVNEITLWARKLIV